jgi:hypothetical protein
LLGLGAQFGPQLALEGRLGAGETLVDPELGIGGGRGAAAGLLQQQHVQLAGDPPGDLGLDRGEVFGSEFMPAGPQILGGRRVGDPHVDPQHPGAAALRAAGDDIFKAPFGLARKVAQDPALVGDRLERQPAAVAQQVGDEVVGEGFHQILLLGIARQIAQRCHRDADARQQTRPGQPRRPRGGYRELLPSSCSVGRAAVSDAIPRAKPRTLGHAAARIVLGDTARARQLVGERLGLGIGGNPELALEGLGAALILAQRLAAAPGARIGAHQSTLAKLRKRVERHQPAAGLDGGIGLAGGILRGGQPLQDVANQGERAVALGRQPFLKGLRIDVKIGQEFATVQIGRSLQLGSVLRALRLASALNSVA